MSLNSYYVRDSICLCVQFSYINEQYGQYREVSVRNLLKKNNGREFYKGYYSVGKKIYQDEGEVVNEGFAFDKEALDILRAS